MQKILLRTLSFTWFQWSIGLSHKYATPSCWDCRFESRRKHGSFSVVNVVCCTERTLRRIDPHPGKSYLAFVILSLIKCQNDPLYLRWVRRRGWNKKICLCQQLVISNYYQKLEMSTDITFNPLKVIPYTNFLTLPTSE